MKEFLIIGFICCCACSQSSQNEIFDDVAESNGPAESPKIRYLDKKKVIEFYRMGGQIGAKHKTNLTKNLREWIPPCIRWNIESCDNSVFNSNREILYIYQRLTFEYGHIEPCHERVGRYEILFKMPFNYLNDDERKKLAKEAVNLSCKKSDWLSGAIDPNQMEIWNSLPVSVAPKFR